MSDVIKKLEKYECHFAPTRSRFIPIRKTVTLTVTYIFTYEEKTNKMH
jgi:hypothetical protein